MFKALEDVMDKLNGIETSPSLESINTPNSSSENLESYVNPDVDREKSIDITLSLEVPKELENKVNETVNEIKEVLEFLEKIECCDKCQDKCVCGEKCECQQKCGDKCHCVNKEVGDSMKTEKKEAKLLASYIFDFLIYGFKYFSFGCSSKNGQISVETSLEPKEIDEKKNQI